MNLSKDQKKLIRFFAIYTPVMILGYAVFSLITGKFEWIRMLGYASGVFVVGFLMAVFYVLGAKHPKK